MRAERPTPGASARPRSKRTAHPRVVAVARSLRTRPGPRRQGTRCHHGHGLRLLLDRLRPQYPPSRRRGRQPHARHASPRQSRQGLPQGLGIARRRRRRRPSHGAALAAKEAVQIRAGLVAAVLARRRQRRRGKGGRQDRVPGLDRAQRRRTFSTTWHWRQRVLNSLAPFSASPSGMPISFLAAVGGGRGGEQEESGRHRQTPAE